MAPGPGNVAGLRRSLGLRDVVLFFVTAGTNFQWIATAAAAGQSSLLVWILGGFAMFLPLSVCVVFLSSRYPAQGGLYVWSKLAFGPGVGFMAGWTYWTSNLPYFPGLLYFAAGNALFLSSRASAQAAASPAYFIGFALGGLALATFLNLRGMAIAKWLSNVGAISRGLAGLILAFLGAATWLKFGSATAFSRAGLAPSLQLTDLIFWATIAFAWTGPEAASFMGEEISDPQRTVPRALAAAAPMIAAIYLTGTLSVLLVLPAAQTSALYGVIEAIRRAAHALQLTWLTPLAAAFVTLACLGSVGAWLGAVARIPFVAGIDSYLPKSFARLHPRYGSPTVAIVTQAAIAAAFTFLGQAGTTVKGAYEVLISMMVVAVMLPFVALFASAIPLSGGAAVPGELAVPGGRPTIITMALIGLATTLGSIALALVPAPDDVHPLLSTFKVVGMTAALLATGAAVYRSGGKRAGAP
ncbi:MAG TPA: APC family permease [Steroidobacteraceae bacterium]|nr:APC family permease [Steroidobacteraceae bacterium]